MARVILVEDDTDLRSSLVDFLAVAGHDAVGVGNAVQLYQAMADGEFDVAVLDINLPHYDGLSIASYLSEKTSMAIILLTVRGAVEDRVKGYRAGADLYLVKPVDCEEFSAAVESLARRRRADPAASGEAGASWLFERAMFRLTAPGGAIIALTRREAQLLERAIQQTGVVVPRPEMLRFLGDEPGDPGSRALDVAISRLRGKVQAESGSALPLLTVQNAGFVFSGRIKSA